MNHQFTPAKQLVSADDWRPVYHLSPAAVLRRVGEEWATVADLDGQLLDGWRFSDRIESDWYLREVELRDPAKRDPVTHEYQRLSVGPAEQQRAQQYRETIENRRYYRMRHVDEMQLNVDAVVMAPPLLNNLNACIAPGDIVVRRVGKVSAALVSSYHRRHPVDANIAILRGLNPRQSAWLAYCLNQPIYRSYFEEPGAIVAMTRVGLKQLSSMPIADRPTAFDKLADQYWQHYERIGLADERLQQLRKDIADWLLDKIPEHLMAERTDGLLAKRFGVRDVDHTLSYVAAEQNHFCRQLVDTYQCVPLSHLAEVNPKSKSSTDAELPIIKIGDVKGQLDIQRDNQASEESRWRFHRQPLNPLAVVVSTFVQDPKVGLFSNASSGSAYASEQLAVLNFHRTPGAYALLLETHLVRQQIARLATGTVQRFVQPEQFKQIVVPPIEDATAQDWHQRLIELQQQRAGAQAELTQIDDAMRSVFRQVHPELTTLNSEGSQLEDNG
ncbi:hypothetical protein [Motilimonas eburnea]|uniref:hypothetical protein n=1 Tax=Motilimonas eburnea TaxID=1737488 RepID=UPI001E5981DD|nr:hypothetical protein [Motilimonas eburnea]MCE2570548.1 hypothetical protein [Motilimonas eburnea]